MYTEGTLVNVVVFSITFQFYRLRKVKMDQRKLMDNANTITDMAKTQNTVYEIVSDLSQRQEGLEDRLSHMEEKLAAVADQLDMLPDLLATRIQSQVSDC